MSGSRETLGVSGANRPPPAGPKETRMLTSHTPAQQDRQRDPKPGRTRALVAAGGAFAAAAAWIIEVPLLGIGLSIRFGGGHQAGGGHVQTIGAGQVVGISLAAALLGWLLLTILEKRTAHARRSWTGLALAALAASLALPLIAATTVAAAAGLIVMHVAVAAVVIPGLARTSR